MKDDITSPDNVATSVQISDITFNEGEIPLQFQVLDIVEETRTKIIQANNIVSIINEVFA
jgi:hypothetical protein